MTYKSKTDTEYRIEFRERLQQMSNEELIETFNREVKNCGWVRVRGIYLNQLQAEMCARDWDISEVNDFGGIGLGKRLKLVGNKVVFE